MLPVRHRTKKEKPRNEKETKESSKGYESISKKRTLLVKEGAKD